MSQALFIFRLHKTQADLLLKTGKSEDGIISALIFTSKCDKIIKRVLRLYFNRLFIAERIIIMKKLLIYLLLFALSISLFSCGGDVSTVTDTNSAAQRETEKAEQSDVDTEITDTDEVIDTVDTESKPNTEKNEESETQRNEETTGEKESEEPSETETEDPRLSMDYAPALYIDADDLYSITKDGIYGDNPGLFKGYDEANLCRDEDGTKYVKYLTYNDYQTAMEAYMSPICNVTTVAPFFAIKYRTTTASIAAEIYCDSVNSSAGGGSGKTAFNYIADGEWHVEIINLKRISNFNGKTLNYMRFDFMNAISGMLDTDSYVEFSYMGFFNTADDAMMFESGEIEKIVYIDPESGYSESTLNHATMIDMINGQNETGIGTYSYRGGNSLAGIDTFMFNNTTFDGGILVFSGWTVIEGGVEKFVWSADNGKTWNDCTMFQATGRGDGKEAHFNAVKTATGVAIIDTENSGKGSLYHGEINESTAKARARGVACDLSAYVGNTVNVVFAAVPKAEADQKKLSLIAYVKGVEVVDDYEEETEAPPEVIDPEIEPEACQEHEKSVEWHPVIGELKEQKLCIKCGSVLEERATEFRLSVDLIEDKNGTIFNGSALGWYGANKVMSDVDAENMQLRGGYDFVVQGWTGLNGGVKSFVFRVDGGEWVACQQKPEQARQDIIDAIESGDHGFVRYADATAYRVSVPLKDHAGKTVTVEFGAVPRNNDGVVVCYLTLVNVKVPELPAEPEVPDTPTESATFVKAVDNLYIGDTKIANPAGAYGGRLFTINASGYDISSNCSVMWQGWLGMNGGVDKYYYSIDGGATWINITGGYGNITRTDIIGALEGMGYTDFIKNGSIGALKIDLSAHIGKTVDVIIGAAPVSAPDKICEMIKFAGLKVTGSCTHSNITEWTPVEGELKEKGVCSCGETVTKNIKSLNNIDIVEGNINGVGGQINPPDGTDLLSRPTDSIGSRAGKDIVVQGWFAVRGGVHKYVYSIDGGNTWLDCGNQPNYGNNSYDKFTGSTGHENAINGANLGFTAADADVNGRYRVTCDLSSKAGETVTVIFGAILENNRTAPPVQMMIITVNVLPNS